MFGFDFSKMAELLPKMEDFGKQVVAVVNEIRAEQRRQGEALRRLCEINSVEYPGKESE